MPELPEVATIIAHLLPLIKGKSIAYVEVLNHRQITSDVKQFQEQLKNQTFLDIKRQGKFIIFNLTNQISIISHLRMEGKYLLLKKDEMLPLHPRVIFHLTNQERLVYDDSRSFGRLELLETSNIINHPSLSSLGPEPIDQFDENQVYQLIKKSSLPIKALLLDQTILAGIGNIYADEILFKSKIHPQLPGKAVNQNEFKRIVKYAKETLLEAIDLGGSTVRSYHPASGIDGRFQITLKAYGRSGQPCQYCQRPLVKIKVKGRGTTFCSHCQINHGAPFIVIITGSMHAGKSTLLKMAQKEGYQTISSDIIVKKLYQNATIIKHINKILKLELDLNNPNLDEIRQLIIKDRAMKKRLEKYLHPLVAQQILTNINESQADIIYIEVPLYYQAKWTHLGNYVIGVTSSYQVQKERIINQYPNGADKLALAQLNDFLAYQDQVDQLLINDGRLEQFINDGLAAIKKVNQYLIQIRQSR